MRWARYLDGAEIAVHGNAQDATGDTMNDGTLILSTAHCGDATGYAMRGGDDSHVRGERRATAPGIRMKAYRDAHAGARRRRPQRVRSFGEYQAGGLYPGAGA